MPITLTEDYVLGIDSIDRQHAKLTDIINRFSEGVARGDQSQKSIAVVFRELSRYAEEHFAYEEAYFVKCGYTGTVAHEHGHRMFLEDIQGFKKRNQEDGSDLVAIELLGFLEEWLTNHILIADKQFVEEFLRCNVR